MLTVISCKPSSNEKTKKGTIVNGLDSKINHLKYSWDNIREKARKNDLVFKEYILAIPTKDFPISFNDFSDLLLKKFNDNDSLYTYLIDNNSIKDLEVIFSSSYYFDQIVEGLKIKTGNSIDDICYDGNFGFSFVVPSNMLDLNKIMPKSEMGMCLIAPLFKFNTEGVITIAYLTVDWLYSPYAKIDLRSYLDDGTLISVEKNHITLMSAMLIDGEYVRRSASLSSAKTIDVNEFTYVFPNLYENEDLQIGMDDNRSGKSSKSYKLTTYGWEEIKDFN